MGRRNDLGELEQIVLLAVWNRPGGYGVEVRDDIEERSGRSVSVSAVHATLVRLEDKGHVVSEMTSPQPVPGGRFRRCFEITVDGIEALRAARDQMNAMWRGLPEAGN